MNTGELAAALGDNLLETSGNTNLHIKGVASDNRLVTPGCLFVCVKGYVTDGHDFADDAITRGAIALIVEGSRRFDSADNPLFARLRVRDSRRALATAASLFYGEPSKKLCLVGVTGTKGKTTVSYMLYEILRFAGMNPGLIGTVERVVDGKPYPSSETTPDSLPLQKTLADMVEASAKAAVMEVSSQGLMLSRVDCCEFDVGIFTNLYRDHIAPREHKDMSDYLSAKLKLFTMCENAIINADSPLFPTVAETFRGSAAGRRGDGVKNINARRTGRLLSYSCDENSPWHKYADVRATNIKYVGSAGTGGIAGTAGVGDVNTANTTGLSVEFFVESPWFSDAARIALPGRFNVSNALAAISVAGLLGLPKSVILSGLSLTKVRGRTEVIDMGQNFTVIVDYAHNAVSLESLLLTLRESNPSHIVTVFGCGGNRSRDRRFDMGEVSGRLSDFTIITSDNPRDEDPARIISDIETGITRAGGQYTSIADRRSAIYFAVSSATAGSVVVIAGKGHETAQEFAGRLTVDFDDAQVAREALRLGL